MQEPACARPLAHKCSCSFAGPKRVSTFSHAYSFWWTVEISRERARDCAAQRWCVYLIPHIVNAQKYTLPNDWKWALFPQHFENIVLVKGKKLLPPLLLLLVFMVFWWCCCCMLSVIQFHNFITQCLGLARGVFLWHHRCHCQLYCFAIVWNGCVRYLPCKTACDCASASMCTRKSFPGIQRKVFRFWLVILLNSNSF